LHFKLHTRPLIREGTPHQELSNCPTKRKLKSDHEPQRGSRHQDRLDDWPSVVASSSSSSSSTTTTTTTTTTTKKQNGSSFLSSQLTLIQSAVHAGVCLSSAVPVQTVRETRHFTLLRGFSPWATAACRQC
jgi:hypothetical protein